MIFRPDAGGLLTIKRTRTLENFRLVFPNFASAQLASSEPVCNFPRRPTGGSTVTQVRK